MTLPNHQQTRIKQLLIDNPKLTVDEIKAKLGRDAGDISEASIAELRADVQHCRRLLEEEGLITPAKKAPAAAGPTSGVPRSLTSSQQARIKLLLMENPDITVDQIRIHLGPDAFVSPDAIADLRANVQHCQRVLKEEGLVQPARKAPAAAAPASGVPRSLTSSQQARIKLLLMENPNITVDQIRSYFGRDVFVSPDAIADLRANVQHCQRTLKEEGLMSPGKK
jgi:uncharacterized protein YneF (UPF0154 family)